LYHCGLWSFSESSRFIRPFPGRPVFPFLHPPLFPPMMPIAPLHVPPPPPPPFLPLTFHRGVCSPPPVRHRPQSTCLVDSHWVGFPFDARTPHERPPASFVRPPTMPSPRGLELLGPPPPDFGSPAYPYFISHPMPFLLPGLPLDTHTLSLVVVTVYHQSRPFPPPHLFSAQERPTRKLSVPVNT